jgi:hypothetical protein
LQYHIGAVIREILMTKFASSSKDLVRAYLAQRRRERRPPPSPDEVRHRLGWTMLMPEFKFATTSGRNQAAATFCVIQEK